MAKKPIRKGGLGRGLGSILPDVLDESTPQDIGKAGIGKIPIEQIETNPFQPRHEESFDPDALKDLSKSIERLGIIQPMTVRRLEENKYQLISGERRFRAAKMAGLAEVPVYIRTADDAQMLEMALVENVKREDLNPIEIALSYQRLISELKINISELVDKVDKKRPTINNYLRLLKLPPDIIAGLRNGDLSMSKARELISIKDSGLQLQLYKEIVEKGLSSRQIEEITKKIREAQDQPKENKKPESKSTINAIHLRNVEKSLEEKFGNKVKLKQKGDESGQIIIHFRSTNDLNVILKDLNVG